MNQSDRPKWSDVKRELQALDKGALIGAIGDLYKLSAGNREFLAARFLSVQTGEMLETYRKRIVHEFYPPRGMGNPKLHVARRAVADYRKATGNVVGALDLMLTYVETGTRFTNDFGDLWESFYSSMESMLDGIVDLLFKRPELYSEVNAAQRLWRLQRDAAGIGWGYGDYVNERVNEVRAHFGDV